MKINDLDFNLPKSLIAQYPNPKRDECKLLVYSRKENTINDTYFNSIINYLNKDDILIFNNTKVFSARLFGYKNKTKAKIEILLLEKINQITWKALLKPAKRIKKETKIIINSDLSLVPIENLKAGQFIIKFNKNVDFELLNEIGEMPLPPYINRRIDRDIDYEYYQTIYAKEYGAVAAPTAGFHFSESLLRQIKDKGCKIGYLTLHISYATFSPIRENNIEEYKMHSEYLIVPQETINLINNRTKNSRIFAVGTTVVRGLESIFISNNIIKPFEGYITTYIYPGYKFKIVDALITNFHLPKSTLLLLVSAFIGLDKLKGIYQHAIQKEYKFFSYGDAMMII